MSAMLEGKKKKGPSNYSLIMKSETFVFLFIILSTELIDEKGDRMHR